MVALPENKNTTVAKIYDWYEANQGGHRPHLGASEIGHQCERYLWYKFRHAFSIRFSGRLLKLFARGHKEEAVFIDELKAIGVEVFDKDENGRQFNFECTENGHFRGSMDAAAKGLPEAPKTWHVVEFKTHSDKSFSGLTKNGAEKSKPQHFAQMQVYMKWTGMTRALYMAVNKNDDSLYVERIKYDSKCAGALTERAKRVTFSPTPLTKISERPDWYECKWCDAYSICHGGETVRTNCRTCCHATPTNDGKWVCEKHTKKLSTLDQVQACDDHLFIPDLVPAKMLDGDTNEGWIKYEKQNGIQFVNSKIDAHGGYLSREISANFSLVGDPGAERLKSSFNAEVVG